MTSQGAERSRRPIVWRLSLASPPGRVFEYVDTDAGRERFWATRSRRDDSSFELQFPNGYRTRVDVLERIHPSRLVIQYLDSRSTFDLTPHPGGGCLFQVTCECDEPDSWMEFYPGWVSWLLVLKAAVDFGVDLRNGSPDRTWDQRFVDQ